jgi:hypothetical protein
MPAFLLKFLLNDRNPAPPALFAQLLLVAIDILCIFGTLTIFCNYMVWGVWLFDPSLFRSPLVDAICSTTFAGALCLIVYRTPRAGKGYRIFIFKILPIICYSTVLMGAVWWLGGYIKTLEECREMSDAVAMLSTMPFHYQNTLHNNVPSVPLRFSNCPERYICTLW